MKFVISIAFAFLIFNFYAQSNTDFLKKEQQKLENKIANTKSLLKKVKNNTQISINELRLIDNQIKSREALVRIFDNQVRVAEIKMVEKKNEIKQLKQKLSRLKLQYRSMLLYAYKHRNNYSKLMYVLSSTNYNEALKRNRYLMKVAGLQNKQVAIILQHQQLINREIKKINEEKESKILAITEKKQEKIQIEIDKNSKEKTFNKFKKEEQKLYAQLLLDEKKKQELKQRINNAIREEILVAERLRKKQAEALEEEKKAAEKQKAGKVAAEKSIKSTADSKKDEKPAEISTPKIVKENVFKESAADIALGKNFVVNKGRLPWPVSGGSITERYGRNAHPTLDGVFTNNNGIDITCLKGGNVRAIFDGQVTSIFSVTGAGKVVIVTHGSYKTVYSNIQEAFVKIGSKVSTKQILGNLLNDGNVSICHFEIQMVTNGTIQSLNPSLWISK